MRKNRSFLALGLAGIGAGCGNGVEKIVENVGDNLNVNRNVNLNSNDNVSEESSEGREVYLCPEQDYEDVACTQEFNPVCGNDGVTYSNACMSCVSGIESYREGSCEESCEGRGVWGLWGFRGLREGIFSCNPFSNDYGDVCSDGSDCEGECLAVSEREGECSELKWVFGCYSTIEDGKVREICVD